MDKFDFSGVDLEVVKTNVRPSSDDKPYLRLSETPGRFTLNGLATKMMELKAGDTVSFFENKNADSIDGWFFIGKADGDNVAKAYSPTKAKGEGVTLSIVQAGTYSRIVQLDTEANEVGHAILAEKGIFTSRPSKTNPNKKNYSSLRTLQYELVEAGEMPMGEGEEPVKLYALVNAKVTNKTEEEVEYPIEGDESDE